MISISHLSIWYQRIAECVQTYADFYEKMVQYSRSAHYRNYTSICENKGDKMCWGLLWICIICTPITAYPEHTVDLILKTLSVFGKIRIAWTLLKSFTIHTTADTLHATWDDIRSKRFWKCFTPPSFSSEGKVYPMRAWHKVYGYARKYESFMLSGRELQLCEQGQWHQ